MSSLSEQSYVVTKAHVSLEKKNGFAVWQAKFNQSIAGFPGFLSLEIRSPVVSANDQDGVEWVFVERFSDSKKLSCWLFSNQRRQLIDELAPFCLNDIHKSIKSDPSKDIPSQEGVTEIFVTEVSPGKEEIYREWIGKIHQVESTFPGFRSVYVQSPSEGKGKSWITILQFDTLENLDRWLHSREREEVLQESESMILALESHRVISPYAGWFAEVSKGSDAALPVWKQAMIVLLVLFPVIMLERIFLSPWLTEINISLATFLATVLSVSLVSWPLVPLAIWFLGWWLSPRECKGFGLNFLGTLVVLFLYAFEIALFWLL